MKHPMIRDILSSTDEFFSLLQLQFAFNSLNDKQQHLLQINFCLCLMESLTYEQSNRSFQVS